MGAGEVGHLVAETLSQENHDVIVIDLDPEKRRIEDELDVRFIAGSGSHLQILRQADVGSCDLFIAASSSEDANLSASLLAKELGAKRTAVRVETTEDLTTHRNVYEKLFQADLLLSPQIQATNRVLNYVLGHNTQEVDYLARGRIQLRKIEVQSDSQLARRSLRDVDLPHGCRLVGYVDSTGGLRAPHPDERAQVGTEAIVVLTGDAIRRTEKLFASSLDMPGTVVIAGATSTGITIARALSGQAKHIKLIERDRRRARHVASAHHWLEVLHGDATDLALLRSENIGNAHAFIGATGNDETNLMAGLEAQELGVDHIVVLVDRSETSRLWERIGDITPISARQLAAKRIADYVAHGYQPNLVSLDEGGIQVKMRHIYPESAVAGATLAQIDPPQGVIVGAVVRGEKVFLPQAHDAIEAGDEVLLFVHPSELKTLKLFFPGKDTVA